jgi:hypothetical protein
LNQPGPGEYTYEQNKIRNTVIPKARSIEKTNNFPGVGEYEFKN